MATIDIGALLAQVGDLSAQIADIRGKVALLMARSGSRATGDGDLAAQVENLQTLLMKFIDAQRGPNVTAPVWHGIDADTWAAQTAELAQWASDVLVLYSEAPGASSRARRGAENLPFPPCWADHPTAVVELSLLRAEWSRIYDRERPTLADALQWHDRYLPGVLGRLNTGALAECSKSGSCVRKNAARLRSAG